LSTVKVFVRFGVSLRCNKCHRDEKRHPIQDEDQ